MEDEMCCGVGDSASFRDVVLAGRVGVEWRIA